MLIRIFQCPMLLLGTRYANTVQGLRFCATVDHRLGCYIREKPWEPAITAAATTTTTKYPSSVVLIAVYHELLLGFHVWSCIFVRGVYYRYPERLGSSVRHSYLTRTLELL